MPLGKRVDTQIKFKDANDTEKLELIIDNIRMNNLYNNLIIWIKYILYKVNPYYYKSSMRL